MNKRMLLPFLMVATLAVQAQVKTDSLKMMKKEIAPKAQLKTLPAQPAIVTTPGIKQAATPTKPTDTPPVAVLTDADYFLAGAIIRVTTGNDNKEASTSTASFYIRPRKSGWDAAYKLEEYSNEIRANQATDLRLDRARDLNNTQNSLQYFKQKGLAIAIAYCNRSFCTDAWKINGITVTLEFKDINGNPAPSGFASRTITFPTADAILGFKAGCNPFWAVDGKHCGFSDQSGRMVLKTDEYFNALPIQLFYYRDDDAN